MARQRMVTRTIETREIDVMCVNVETAEVKILTLTVGQDYNKSTDTLKMLRKHHETETVKIVSVVNEKVTTKLYGMLEQDFIKYAEVLPNRVSADVEGV